MKVTVNVECTASEARDFLGLPNVQPMQASMMDQIEKKMLASIDQLSPESILRNWMTFAPDQILDTVKAMFGGVRAGKTGD